ncbi:MAG TPA: adenylate/guanylate cyclase domain-containing protein, partial [Myxococcota bacterium]
MDFSWISLALQLGLAGLSVGLWLLLRHSRQETGRLKQRIESAAGKLQNLQLAFSRFAPDEIIERVIADGHGGIGEKKEVTVLFADLVGFTALSEQTEPTVLVGVLNGYFDRMSEAISQHRGYVSTFIGDGILALFGALSPNPWQGNDAVHAALAMREALASYNRELVERGISELSVGIGLNGGAGVAGLVGSRDLKEFAFVGGVANVAARVQDLTRQHSADIIVTAALKESLDPRFQLRALPTTRVKGVAEPLSLYAVDGFADIDEARG